MGSVVARARRRLRDGGPSAVTGALVAHLRERLWCDEEHVWYELEPGAQAPQPPLEPLRLVHATGDQLELVEQLERSAISARDYAARGHDLCLVLDGERAVFGCWLHRGETPMAAARGGWLALPAGLVCLEDSVTSADQRGRGTAPRAWATIADELAGGSTRAMITKVAVDNAPSRRAVAKAGFREVAVMKLHRRGPLTRVRVMPLDGSATGARLRELLDRG